MARREAGQLIAEVAAVLREHPEYSPREVVAALPAPKPADETGVRRIMQARHGWPVRTSPGRAQPKQPPARPPASKLPVKANVLSAVLSAHNGTVTGADLAAMEVFIRVPDVHHHGRRVVRDPDGNMFALHDL